MIEKGLPSLVRTLLNFFWYSWLPKPHSLPSSSQVVLGALPKRDKSQSSTLRVIKIKEIVVCGRFCEVGDEDAR